jgi:hypothetical protein
MWIRIRNSGCGIAAHLKLTAIEELRYGGGRIAPEPAGAADTNCPPHRLHQPAFKIKGTVSRDGFGSFFDDMYG